MRRFGVNVRTTMIADDAVHVWLLWHRNATTDTDSLTPNLSRDEQERAARFLNERARLEFCLTRSALRQLLSSYGVGPASEIDFEYDDRGKPKLAACHDESKWLQFNVAHTRELSAIAVARNNAVGVDVEFQRDVTDADRIVESKFATEERHAYSSSRPEVRKSVFFRGWTRKEAFIKATGEGLCRSLSSFAVTIESADDTRFLRIDDDNASNWSLINLTVGDRHAGAVAMQRQKTTLVCRELS